jgi:hypothetical protein
VQVPVVENMPETGEVFDVKQDSIETRKGDCEPVQRNLFKTMFARQKENVAR